MKDTENRNSVKCKNDKIQKMTEVLSWVRPLTFAPHTSWIVIVHWVYIRRIWRPLIFCGEIWTAGPQPVLCPARRCALYVPKDEYGGQPAIALKER